MKFFIADTHFCHESIIQMGNRPFTDVEDMNRQMIQNWNSVVAKSSDEVYILGDFMHRGSGSDANRILRKLRGRKFLIKGNHEKYLTDSDFDSAQFEWIKDYYSFKENKKKVVLFHYPILEWEQSFRGSIHLYGHVHNTRPEYFAEILGPRAVNVGAEMIGYTPISLQQVVSLVDAREKAEN